MVENLILDTIFVANNYNSRNYSVMTQTILYVLPKYFININRLFKKLYKCIDKVNCIDSKLDRASCNS